MLNDASELLELEDSAAGAALIAHSHRTPRVLMIVESAAGGTGRHVLDLCEGMLSRGCDVHLIHSTNRIDDAFGDRLREIPRIARLGLPMRTAVHPADFSALRAARKYAKEFGPFDVIHGHSSKGGAIARLAALGTSAAAIYTLHGLIMMDPGLNRLKKSIYTAIEIALSWRTHAIIAVSPEEQRAAIKLGLGESRVRLVPNGVAIKPLRARSEARAELRAGEDEILVGFVGRLVNQKAPHVLIDAFALAAALLPNLRLVMIGAGPLARSLQTQSLKLGVAEKIRWLGERDATAFWPALDLFAMSSRKEGLPYVILEAMAAGLPIVATASSGVESLIEPGLNGEIVPTDDSRAMAQAIVQLAQDPSRLEACARASRERARSFSVDAMVQRTLDLYREAMSVSPVPVG